MQRQTMKRSIVCIALVPVVLLCLAGNAFAYLDPSAGSMMLQGLVAVVAGGLIVARRYWHSISAMFGRKRPTADANPDQDGPGKEAS